MSRSVRLAVLALAVAGSAGAQEALPLLPEILAQVQDSEVYLKGYLGKDGEGVSFALPEAGHVAFPVTFDGVDETAIAGCDFAGPGPCRVAAYGYVQWDGPGLRVFVTSIETMDPPGGMTP